MPSATPTFPRRGEIYLATLDKDRPVLILSVDSLNRYALDACVVPITSVQRSQFSMRVPLAKGEGDLNSNCWAKCDQGNHFGKIVSAPKAVRHTAARQASTD